MPDDKGVRCRTGTKKVGSFRGHSNSSFIVMIYRRVSSRNYLHNSIDGIPVVHIADKIGNMNSGYNSVGYSLSR